MKAVKSSNISHIGFENGTLKVRFSSGSEYHYADVPAHLHNEFMSAESKGKYFAQHIKGKFEHKKQEKS